MAYEPEFWDRFFRQYDRLNEIPAYVSLLDRTAALCAPKPGARILDAGAGTGNLLSRLADAGAAVAALDANRRGLVRARGKAQALWAQGTLEGTLPFADAAFDAIACILVLHALSDAGRARCFSEFRRVLRPGGRFVVGIPATDSNPLRIYADAMSKWIRAEGLVRGVWRTARFVPPAVAILYYSARITMRARGGPYRFYGREELVTQLERTGFSVGGAERSFAGQVWLVFGHKA